MRPARWLLACLAALAALLLVPAGASAAPKPVTVSAPSAAAVALKSKGTYAITLARVSATQGRAAVAGLLGAGLADPTLSGTARGRSFSARLSVTRVNYDAAGRRLRLRARTLGGAIPGQVTGVRLTAQAVPSLGAPIALWRLTSRITNHTPFTMVLTSQQLNRGTQAVRAPADQIAPDQSVTSQWQQGINGQGVQAAIAYRFMSRSGAVVGRAYVTGSANCTTFDWQGTNGARVETGAIVASWGNDGNHPAHGDGFSTWTTFTAD